MFEVTAQTGAQDLSPAVICYGISCAEKKITVNRISTDLKAVERIAAKLNKSDIEDCDILREVIEDSVTELYL